MNRRDFSNLIYKSSLFTLLAPVGLPVAQILTGDFKYEQTVTCRTPRPMTLGEYNDACREWMNTEGIWALNRKFVSAGLLTPETFSQSGSHFQWTSYFKNLETFDQWSLEAGRLALFDNSKIGAGFSYQFTYRNTGDILGAAQTVSSPVRANAISV